MLGALPSTVKIPVNGYTVKGYLEDRLMLKKSKTSKMILLLLAMSGLSTFAADSVITIENDFCRVRWDKSAARLSLYDKSSGISYLKEIALGENPASASVGSLVFPELGKGKTLVIHYPQGSRDTVMLFDSLPFVAIRRTVRSGKDVSIDKLQQLWGRVDLGVAADQLRTLGTAGLTMVGGGDSYAFMAVGDPASGRGVVCGWLTHDRGSGIVLSQNKEGKAMLQARIDYGQLLVGAGEPVEGETLLIGYFDDVRRGLEQYAEAIVRHYKIRLPEQPVFYMTWYNRSGGGRSSGASDEDRIKINSEFVRKNLMPFGLNVMQIDDHWQLGQGGNGPKRNFSAADPRPNGPYPSGMKKTADMMHAKGLTPGIWFIPFAGTWSDPYWADKQDLLLKQGSSPYNDIRESAKKRKIPLPDTPEEDWPFVARWGGTCLDLTNPKTHDYLSSITGRISREWGYKFFKMDGLWTGTGTRLQYVNTSYRDDNLGKPRRFNPKITAIEAYRSGLKTIRKTIGDDVFLLGCSSTQNMRTFGGSFGLVDAMRVGPDNGAGRNLINIVKAVKFASRYYFMEERIWFIDPDSFSIRDSVSLIPTRSYFTWITLCGMLNSTSVFYPDLSSGRLDILRRTMPSHRLKTFYPVDYLENEPAKIWVLTDRQAGPKRTVVGLFSWESGKDVEFNIPLEKLGLDAKKSYLGFDYWGNRFLQPVKGSLVSTVDREDCQVISFKAAADHPQVLGTSRHITQGSVDLLQEKWDGATGTLSGISRVVGGDRYEIRIAAPFREQSWQISKVRLNDAPAAKISYTQDGPFARVLIESPQSGEINWAVTYRPATLSADILKAVSSLKATVDGTRVTLGWEYEGNTPFNVTVTRGEYKPLTYSVAPGKRTFVDAGSEYSSRNSYTVQALNWKGRPSRAVTVTDRWGKCNSLSGIR